MGKEDIIKLVKNSFNSSFISDDLKKEYIKKVEQIINNEKTKGQI